MNRATKSAVMGVLLAGAIALSASADVLKVGLTAPKWQGKTVSGQSMSLAGLKGKVVLLNFFNNYCTTCHEEYPHLAALHKKYGPKGFTVISVSNDETAAEAGNFAKEIKAPFPVIHDPKNTIFGPYKADLVPANVLIDRTGKIVWSKDAGVDLKGMEAAIQKALK